jgi:hypothetical protein
MKNRQGEQGARPRLMMIPLSPCRTACLTGYGRNGILDPDVFISAYQEGSPDRPASRMREEARMGVCQALRSGEPVVAPLCYDPLTSKLVEYLGFPAASPGGGAPG